MKFTTKEYIYNDKQYSVVLTSFDKCTEHKNSTMLLYKCRIKIGYKSNLCKSIKSDAEITLVQQNQIYGKAIRIKKLVLNGAIELQHEGKRKNCF